MGLTLRLPRSGKFHQVTHDAIEAIDLADDDVQIHPLLGVVFPGRLEVLDQASDGPQGVADFMRNAGSQASERGQAFRALHALLEGF
jgi:hypothetical protein